MCRQDFRTTHGFRRGQKCLTRGLHMARRRKKVVGSHLALLSRMATICKMSPLPNTSEKGSLMTQEGPAHRQHHQQGNSNPEHCQAEPPCLQLQGESCSLHRSSETLLEYASPVLDLHTISCSNSIEKVQKCAERWATQDYKPTSIVTAILEELNWPLLQSRRKKARLSML